MLLGVFAAGPLSAQTITNFSVPNFTSVGQNLAISVTISTDSVQINSLNLTVTNNNGYTTGALSCPGLPAGGTGSVNVNCTGTYVVQASDAGSYGPILLQLSGSYSGTGGGSISNSPQNTSISNKSTTVGYSASPGTSGTANTITVTVSTHDGGTAGGNVTFTLDGTPHVLTLSGGSATYAAGVLSAGSHPASASYPGAGGYAASSASYPIVIVDPLVITTSSPLPDATVSAPYSQTLSASGGTSPYYFYFNDANSPPWATLDDTTGLLHGTPTGAGDYTFEVVVYDDNFLDAYKTFTLHVGGGALSLTSTPSATTQVGQSYSQTNVASGGSTPYGYSITAGSIPAGTSFSSSTGTVSGTPTTAGAFSYDVTVTDNASATAAHTVSGTIAQGTQAISFTSMAPGAAVVGGSTYTVSATGGASGNPVTFSINASSSSVCTIATNVVSFIGVGTCRVDAAQAGNSNYTAASNFQSFSVGQGSQTITFTSTAPSSAVVAGPTYAVSATGGGSGNPVTFSINASSSTVCSIAGSTVSFIGVGTCRIDAAQAGNTNYTAGSNFQSFSVGQGSQTITFTSMAPGAAVVGGSTYTVSATGGASGNPVTFSINASSSSVCTIATNVVSFIGVGTCQIDAAQAANTNYAAGSNSQSFGVGQGAQTITFTSTAPSSAVVAGPTYTVSATGGPSGNPVTFSINVASSTVCTIATNVVSFIGVGTCQVDAAQAGDTNYAAGSNSQSFAVGQGANVISFPGLPNTAFTSTPPTPNATASSTLAVTCTSATTGVCTVTLTGTITFVSAGICTINADQAGDTNYVAAVQAQQSFTITQGVNTITFGGLSDRALNSGGFTVSATASSGLTVSFASTTVATCGVSGTTVTLLAVGTCTIEATQPGDTDYVAATPVDQSFQVLKAVTTVTLTSSDTAPLFGVPITLTATVTGASPTGTVTFLDGANTLGTGTLSGGTATLTLSSLAIGAHSLTASYGGDGSNNSGTSAALSVTVNDRPDPSQDPDVRAGVDTQVTTTDRFVGTQMDNINNRLDQMHDEDDNDNAGGFNVTVGNASTQSDTSSALAYADTDNQYLKAGGAIFEALEASGTQAQQRMHNRFHLWANGAVEWGSQDQPGADDRFRTEGVTVGFDARWSARFKSGIAVGFGKDNTDIGSNGSTSDAKNLTVSAYGDLRVLPRTYLDLIGGYGRGAFDTHRFATGGGVFVNGSRDTEQWFGSIGLTANQKWSGFKFAPYARVDAEKLQFDPYTETGSPIWALSYQGMDTTVVSGVVGLRTGYDFPVSWGTFGVRAGVEDTFRIAGDYKQRLGYADLTAGPVYSISDQAVSDNQITGNVGLNAGFNGVNLDARYWLSGSDAGIQSQAVSLGVDLPF